MTGNWMQCPSMRRDCYAAVATAFLHASSFQKLLHQKANVREGRLRWARYYAHESTVRAKKFKIKKCYFEGGVSDGEE